MKTFFKPTFIKDFNSLNPEIRQQAKKFCVEAVPAVRHLRDLSEYNIKPLKGFKDYYRVRLGDHRIGFKKEGNAIIFMRVLDRRDIYRYFP